MSRNGRLIFTLVVFIFLGISGNLNAQSDEILMVADEMPVFPGGPKALMEAIYKNISYPADAKEDGIQGKVILKFAVSKEGKAILPAIVKGLSPSIDKVVLSVVDKLPKFEPAKMAGKPVSVWFAVPVTFMIQ